MFQRDDSGRVALFDTKTGKTVHMNPCSAREALRHPEGATRFQTEETRQAAAEEDRINALVEKRVSEKSSDKEEELSDDDKEIFRLAVEEIRKDPKEGDLTKADNVSKSGLQRVLGREVTNAERLFAQSL